MKLKADIYCSSAISIYDEMTRDELLETIFNQDDYILELELKIAELEKEKTNKINQDFQDNKKMIGNILNNLVK